MKKISDLVDKGEKKVTTIINEPTYIEDISKLILKYQKKTIHGVEIDCNKIEDKRYFVKKAFQILSNRDFPKNADGTQWRTLLIHVLEKLLRTQFQNTRDLKHKINNFLKNYEVRNKPAGERIERARRKKKWSQRELAEHLGYKSHVSIAQYEKGLRYPPQRVFDWLDELGM